MSILQSQANCYNQLTSFDKIIKNSEIMSCHSAVSDSRKLFSKSHFNTLHNTYLEIEETEAPYQTHHSNKDNLTSWFFTEIRV